MIIQSRLLASNFLTVKFGKAKIITQKKIHLDINQNMKKMKNM